jgi:hypothetical protein
MKLEQILRKFTAVMAVIGLLLISMPTLAEALAVPELPSCCNSIYCPMRHQNAHAPRGICNMQTHAAGNDCSMQACNMPANSAVGTALFVLVVPVTISSQTIAEPAPLLASLFFPFHLQNPSIPPPRALQS